MAKAKAKNLANEALPLRLEWRSPAELTVNPRNWRRHPEAQQAALAGVLSEVGWAGACLLNETTGLLIDGHLRQKVALANGAERIPVLVGRWTPEQEAKILATLDPIAGLAEADPVALDALLRDVDTSCQELADMLTQLWEDNKPPDEPAPIEEDEAPEPRADVVTRPGDLWTIPGANGMEHRLLCGDCRDPAAWERLLGGERVNVCFTSPPYASQRKYDESSGFRPIPPDEYVAWWEPLQANVRKNLAGDGSFFVNIKPHCEDGERVLYVFDLVLKMKRAWGWRFVDELCWKKPGLPGEHLPRFRNDFEPVYQFCGDEVTMPRYGNVLVAGKCVKGDGGGSENQGSGGSNLGQNETWDGMVRPSNVIQTGTDRLGDITGHTAAFPVGLPSFFIRAFSDPGDIIADPFMGSFSTGMAAEANGRRAVGMELSAGYVDVCLRRYVAKYPDADPVRHDGTKWSELTA